MKMKLKNIHSFCKTQYLPNIIFDTYLNKEEITEILYELADKLNAIIYMSADGTKIIGMDNGFLYEPLTMYILGKKHRFSNKLWSVMIYAQNSHITHEIILTPLDFKAVDTPFAGTIDIKLSKKFCSIIANAIHNKDKGI